MRGRAGRGAPRAALPGGALTVVLGIMLAVAGCSDGPDGPDQSNGSLSVEGAYLPEPVTDQVAAGFLVVRNDGDTADQLTGVSSDISEDVQIHETVDQRMRQVDALPVPADGELRLERGGSHLMFMDLQRKPSKGDEVSVKLHFAHSDPITLRVPVEATNHVPEHLRS